jgi:hypothetical protein
MLISGSSSPDRRLRIFVFNLHPSMYPTASPVASDYTVVLYRCLSGSGLPKCYRLLLAWATVRVALRNKRLLYTREVAQV